MFTTAAIKMCLAVTAPVVLVAAVSLQVVAAAEISRLLVERGGAIAEAKCSVCHAVGATGDSPAPANRDTPFRRLHERYPIAMLEEAVKSGDISGHDEMPGFHFEMDEIEALLAYIDSLAPDKPRYLNR